jgi:hypothetical protein
MLRHPEFSMSQWEQAPQYWGPGIRELQHQGNATVLDFEALQMIAEAQASSGAFQSDGMEVSKAPLKLGNVPASFLDVVSEDFDDFVVHTPLGPEILVVIDGLLTIKNFRQFMWRDMRFKTTSPLHSGDVLTLEPEGVKMKAQGLHKNARSLVLAIYNAPTINEDLVISKGRYNGKMVDSEDIKLPYLNELE